MSNIAKVALGDICEVNIGRTPARENREYWGVGFPWLSIADMNQGRVLSKTKEQITQRAVVETRMQPAPTGTVLLSFKLSIGKVGIAATPLFTNEAIAALSIKDPTKLIPEFLFWALQSIDLTAGQDRAAMGLTLNKAKLLTLQIPVPPLEEQRRIAAILDQAETLRTQRRTALALLDNLTQSLFLDMFGDPVANPKQWPKVPLTQTCASSDDIRCGPFGTQLLRSEFKTEGVPLWGIKNVNAKFEIPTHEFVDEQTAKRLSQYSIEPLDIVMTRKGTVGNCAVYPTSFPSGVMHSDLLRLRVSSKICLSTFLSHQLHHSQDVERQLTLISGGAVMPGINVSRLKELLVFLPPLPLQQTFATRIASIEALKATHRRALAALDTLFASLQQRAFAGQL